MWVKIDPYGFCRFFKWLSLKDLQFFVSAVLSGRVAGKVPSPEREPSRMVFTAYIE